MKTKRRKLSPKEIDKVFAKAREQGKCIDCKRDTYKIGEYYMVHDWLWQSADMSPNGGMLCIKDIERRLKRKLTSSDFFLCPLNVMNLSDDKISRTLMRRMTH